MTGGTVAGHDNLLLGLVQGVKGVKEFVLGPFAVEQKLDVVDQEDIHVAVETLKLIRLIAISERLDEIAHKFFRGDVNDLLSEVEAMSVMPNRLEQMRFP